MPRLLLLCVSHLFAECDQQLVDVLLLDGRLPTTFANVVQLTPSWNRRQQLLQGTAKQLIHAPAPVSFKQGCTTVGWQAAMDFGDCCL
jgi:hypothetical protein